MLSCRILPREDPGGTVAHATGVHSPVCSIHIDLKINLFLPGVFLALTTTKCLTEDKNKKGNCLNTFRGNFKTNICLDSLIQWDVAHGLPAYFPDSLASSLL